MPNCKFFSVFMYVGYLMGFVNGSKHRVLQCVPFCQLFSSAEGCLSVRSVCKTEGANVLLFIFAIAKLGIIFYIAMVKRENKAFLSIFLLFCLSVSIKSTTFALNLRVSRCLVSLYNGREKA